ncbi:MAG TPA: hypothetical protein VMG10_11085 [Gemmataceae bacterium]|nr:hypothetical protein [Gemmataceae bacterium]
MLDELRAWWQTMTPQTHEAIQTGGLVIAALLGGQFLGSIVARALRAKNFDAALRLPSLSAVAREQEHGITPTFVAGLLIRLTVWAGAAWWLAHQHDRVELADTLVLVLKRTWTLGIVFAAALALGSLLARRVMDCLRGFPKAGAAVVPSRNENAAPRWDVAGLMGAGVYLLIVLLVLLIAADVLDWPLTRASALALWHLAQNLLVAGAALLIGSLGARWARDLTSVEGASSPERRAAQYTGLSIMGVTTILAVAVLLSSAGVLIGLASLAILALLLWLGRGYLPDVTAGLQLRVHNVREVWFEGEAWQVSEVGLLTTQVNRRGEFCRLQNRVVLEARMQGAPSEAAPR